MNLSERLIPWDVFLKTGEKEKPEQKILAEIDTHERARNIVLYIDGKIDYRKPKGNCVRGADMIKEEVRSLIDSLLSAEDANKCLSYFEYRIRTIQRVLSPCSRKKAIESLGRVESKIFAVLMEKSGSKDVPA